MTRSNDFVFSIMYFYFKTKHNSKHPVQDFLMIFVVVFLFNMFFFLFLEKCSLNVEHFFLTFTPETRFILSRTLYCDN